MLTKEKTGKTPLVLRGVEINARGALWRSCVKSFDLHQGLQNLSRGSL